MLIIWTEFVLEDLIVGYALSCVDLQLLSVLDKAFSEFDRALLPEVSDSLSRDKRVSDMPEKVFDRRTDGSVFDFRAVFSSFESTTELEAPPNQDVSSGRGSGGATGGSRAISTALVDASTGNDI